MQRLDLEQTIHEFIRNWYRADYVGLLIVNEKNGYYTLVMGLPSYMLPTTISLECSSDDDFLNYIYNELKVRNYMRLDIYKVKRHEDSREE